MTAQISDTFIFRNEKYQLIGKMGGELFYPFNYDMIPEMLHTACYQGFYSTYEIKKDQLYLQQLTIREKNGNYPSINGIEPEKEKFLANYNNLNKKISFNGKLRIANGFIEDLYIHMGFQKASAYKIIFDLTLTEGKIIHVLDRSEEIEKKRGAFKKEYESNENPYQSIQDAFSLDMGWE